MVSLSDYKVFISYSLDPCQWFWCRITSSAKYFYTSHTLAHSDSQKCRISCHIPQVKQGHFKIQCTYFSLLQHANSDLRRKTNSVKCFHNSSRKCAIVAALPCRCRAWTIVMLVWGIVATAFLVIVPLLWEFVQTCRQAYYNRKWSKAEHTERFNGVYEEPMTPPEPESDYANEKRHFDSVSNKSSDIHSTIGT